MRGHVENMRDTWGHMENMREEDIGPPMDPYRPPMDLSQTFYGPSMDPL